MAQFVSKSEYEEITAASRDARMAWWREARFGMFIHYGLYSALGRHEWAMASENWPVNEYEKLAAGFLPKQGAPNEWAALAKKAGMKYMVLTTRHHEGFSLWDSKVNPYNSVNYGPKRDIVREFVEACRANNMRIGFYTSLMDWHHPDGGAAAYDSAARKRFNDYIYTLNEELLTQYGKIDILWYDVARPMENYEGWNSLEINQRLRAIQPDIIINNRSRLDEDFGTPEERVTAEKDRDWESCMTFNGLSWGYVDSAQAGPHSYNAQRILKMLATCSEGAGNLLLNIGPQPDGSVPPEAVEPLTTVGKWLAKNGEAAYGKVSRFKEGGGIGSRLCSMSKKGKIVYLWNWIWPPNRELILGGFKTPLVSAKLLADGRSLPFTQEKYRIILKNLPADGREPVAGVTVIALEFNVKPGEEIETQRFAARPPLNGGRVFE
ncbi:MAG: alpha-L-fucosidase [Treponema sp.]|nr:alpha-L-fucosidase [Treponema sp.]